jgi:hypothetical protein
MQDPILAAHGLGMSVRAARMGKGQRTCLIILSTEAGAGPAPQTLGAPNAVLFAFGVVGTALVPNSSNISIFCVKG